MAVQRLPSPYVVHSLQLELIERRLPHLLALGGRGGPQHRYREGTEVHHIRQFTNIDMFAVSPPRSTLSEDAIFSLPSPGR